MDISMSLFSCMLSPPETVYKKYIKEKGKRQEERDRRRIKNTLTKWCVFSYNATVANAIGAWCNGNTWVSKTFVEGSNPSAPAENLHRQMEVFLMFTKQMRKGTKTAVGLAAIVYRKRGYNRFFILSTI